MSIKDSCLGSGSLHPNFFGFRQSSEKVKLAKRTVLYPALNPKNLDVEQLTLSTNSNINSSYYGTSTLSWSLLRNSCIQSTCVFRFEYSFFRAAGTGRAGRVMARPKFSTTLSTSCLIYRCCLSVGRFGWPRFDRTYISQQYRPFDAWVISRSQTLSEPGSEAGPEVLDFKIVPGIRLTLIVAILPPCIVCTATLFLN